MRFWERWLGRIEGCERDANAETQGDVVMAYRAWRMSGDRLISCTCDCEWRPRERMDARCNNNVSHVRVPAWDCKCGFYAYKTASALAASEYVGLPQGLTVQGRVALWGRVIHHALGYRAEYAYPQILYLRGDRYDADVRRIADWYAVDCVPC
jgi:hypothetical protein